MDTPMSEAFIISAIRSPVGIGKPTGALAPITPINLTALIMQEALIRAQVEATQVEDVIWGCVTQIGDQGANLARLAVLKAGFPVEVPGVTLNRMCGSSQQAVHFASLAILAGDMEIVLAGGTEMMSHQPIGSDWPEQWPDDFPYPLVHQGISAEMIAEKWELNRDELDDFAYHSHLRRCMQSRTATSTTRYYLSHFQTVKWLPEMRAYVCHQIVKRLPI